MSADDESLLRRYECIYWNSGSKQWMIAEPLAHHTFRLHFVFLGLWLAAFAGSGLWVRGCFLPLVLFFCICLRFVLNGEFGKCLLSVSRIGGNGGHTNPGDGRQWMRCVSLSLNERVCEYVSCDSSVCVLASVVSLKMCIFANFANVSFHPNSTETSQSVAFMWKKPNQQNHLASCVMWK